MQMRAIPVLVLLAIEPARAAACPATALLEGDGALVGPIDAALEKRGIATTATPECPAAKAHIARDAESVIVTVTDPNGRRSQRKLADHDAAASLIESWARQDINAMALLGFTDPAPLATEPPPRVDAVAPASVVARPRDPVSVVAALESSFGFDGTSWLGARAGACLRIGPVCAGANARLLSADQRRSYDVLAGVELPIALASRVVVIAGGGVGVGWFQTPFMDGEAMTTVTSTGVRLDGHVSLSWSIARSVSLHAGFSLGASPQAPYVIQQGDLGNVTNGEPSGFLRGDIGLRIGAP